jgi:hypothetical protein
LYPVDDIYGLVWSNNTLYGFSNSQDAMHQIDTSTGVATQLALLTSLDNIVPNGVYGAATLPT